MAKKETGPEVVSLASAQGPTDPVTEAPASPAPAQAPVVVAPAPPLTATGPTVVRKKFSVTIPHNPGTFLVEAEGTSATELGEWEKLATEACMKLCGITTSVHKFQVMSVDG